MELHRTLESTPSKNGIGSIIVYVFRNLWYHDASSMYKPLALS